MKSQLISLEAQLKQDLKRLEIPPAPWLLPASEDIMDVIIVGGGMAGLAAAFALIREGIHNIKVLDASPKGYEGPWKTYARMRTLRSSKGLPGPALGIPNLTFAAWFTAQYGEKEWEKLYKIPTPLWMDYLCWYKKILTIPVENKEMVSLIKPQKDLIALHLKNGEHILARKVVLATGRAGFGGLYIPACAQHLPKKFCAHTSDAIDFKTLKGQTVIILGAGSSAFDAAAEALEHGAKSVTMLTRRPTLPNKNKFARLAYPGCSQGFYLLPDQAKVKFIKHSHDAGGPPPFESLDRVKKNTNFKALMGIEVESIQIHRQSLHVKTTTQLDMTCDFLILGTGFEIDGSKQPELKSIFKDILLWKDRLPKIEKSLGLYPYVGPHFEFLEKASQKAPYLKNIYCFNYSAILSHGLTSGDIPDISTGAARLAKGITADFFTQHWEGYFERLEGSTQTVFLPENYAFI